MAFLQQYPDKAAEVMAPVAEKLKELNVDVVVGPAMGGIVYAYELGRQMGKRAIFTERVDNVMTLKRFRINPVSAASSPRTLSPPAFPASRRSASSRRTAASAWALPASSTAPAPRPSVPSRLSPAPSSSTCPTTPRRMPHLQGGQVPPGHLGSRKMKEQRKDRRQTAFSPHSIS